MLKNILNLEGAQKLTKNEQKSINGGVVCNNDACIINTCYRTVCNSVKKDMSCCS